MSSKPQKPAALDASKSPQVKHAAVTLFNGNAAAICGSKTGLLSNNMNGVNCQKCLKDLFA